MPYAATIPEPTSRTLAGKSNAFSSTPPDLGNGACCLGACCLAAFCCCLAAFCSCLAALRAAFSSGLCCAIVGAAPTTITMAIMKPTLITIMSRLTGIASSSCCLSLCFQHLQPPPPYQNQRTSKHSEDPIRFPANNVLGHRAETSRLLCLVLLR